MIVLTTKAASFGSGDCMDTLIISEAEELLQTLDGDLHSMIDVSDGLGQDASHLAKDGIQLVIDTTLLPLRSGATIEGLQKRKIR